MNKKLFWLILILAFILRFYKLGQVPAGLDWDENSNAYNAYSILKTGRDEYGNFLPLVNRSFDDYKPPLYMYLNVPTVAIFGLTPFAARLPSAILGFLTVPIVYFLAKKLFEKSNVSGQLSNVKRETIALIAMFLFTISSWHIQFSRVGFEATVGLFFAIAAITCLLYGLEKKPWLIISSLLAGLALYSYHAQRIFIPIIFVAIFVIWRNQILAISRRYLLAFFVMIIILLVPLVILTPSKAILQRLETTSSEQRLTDIEKSISFISQDEGWLLAKYVHNRRVTIGQTFFANYLSHFDLNFLFTKGDGNYRHHIEGMGMLYLFQLPLVIYGIYLLLKNRSKISLFLMAWLLVAPVAAVPSDPAPHAIRSLPMVVPFQIISAYALFDIISRKFMLKKYAILGLSIFIFLSVAVYLHNYWIHYASDKASFWQYGYRETVIESENLKVQFEKINVHRSLEEAYIFWLFNTQYDPATYQNTGNRYNFDKYYFDAKQPIDKNELFISDAGSFPQDFEILKTIYYPNGSEALKIGHPR